MDKKDKYINFVVDRLIDESKVWVTKKPEMYVTVLIPTEKFNYHHYKSLQDYNGSSFMCSDLEYGFDEWFRSDTTGEVVVEDYEFKYLTGLYGINSEDEATDIMVGYESNLFLKVREFCEKK